MTQNLVYSEERGTWNLFVDGEWYAEGTYEQMDDMMFNNAVSEDTDNCGCDCYGGSDYYGDDEYEEDYEITSADLHDYMYGI